MLADQPHHDGSTAVHRSRSPRALGATTRGLDSCAGAISVWNVHASDRCPTTSRHWRRPRSTRIGLTSDEVTWWVAELPLHNPLTNYRFLLEGGAVGYAWLNGSGIHHHDVPDAFDFRITTAAAPPTWLDGTIGYQVFLDRFATSGERRKVSRMGHSRALGQRRSNPDNAISTEAGLLQQRPRRHREAPRPPRAPRGRPPLPHPVLPVGISAPLRRNNLRPRRPAARRRRRRWRRLSAAAHDRGIRVIGDITLNHTGSSHTWFRRAQSEPDVARSRLLHVRRNRRTTTSRGTTCRRCPNSTTAARDLANRLYDGPDSTIAAIPRAPVRTRRMARRLRQHHRSLGRRRPQPRRRAGNAAHRRAT